MTDYTVKADDDGGTIDATLEENGSAVDLTGASILFLMADAMTGASKVSAAATIVTAAAGTVTYTWAAADLDTPGSYRAEWQVTFADATIATFPSAGYNSIEILADLN